MLHCLCFVKQVEVQSLQISTFDLGEEAWQGSQTRLLGTLSRQITKTYIETAQTLWPTHFTLLMGRRVSPSGGEHRSSGEPLEIQKFTSGVNFSCFILCPFSHNSNTCHCTQPCSRPSATSPQALMSFSKPPLLHTEQVWVSQPLLAEQMS